jgi:AcrR family transcriptional regulator
MKKASRASGEDQARVEERRRQILAAAAAVFARRGYHRARTREIAREAGVAEGTLYNYFATKRDLLIALIQQVTTESMPGALAHIDETDPRSWLTAVLRDRLTMLERNRALFKAVVPEIIADHELQHAYFRQVVAPFLAELEPVAGHILHSSQTRAFEPRVVLPAVIGGVAAAFFFNQQDLGSDVGMPHWQPASSEQILRELVDLFIDGVRQREVALPEGWHEHGLSDTSAPEAVAPTV